MMSNRISIPVHLCDNARAALWHQFLVSNWIPISVDLCNNSRRTIIFITLIDHHGGEQQYRESKKLRHRSSFRDQKTESGAENTLRYT